MSAEPLWIALRSDWLSVHTAAASCVDKSHSSAMRMAAFSSSYVEVKAAPCYCQAICVDKESGIQVSGECQLGGNVIFGAGGARLSACTLQLLESLCFFLLSFSPFTFWRLFSNMRMTLPLDTSVVEFRGLPVLMKLNDALEWGEGKGLNLNPGKCVQCASSLRENAGTDPGLF